MLSQQLGFLDEVWGTAFQNLSPMGVSLLRISGGMGQAHSGSYFLGAPLSYSTGEGRLSGEPYKLLRIHQSYDLEGEIMQSNKIEE